MNLFDVTVTASFEPSFELLGSLAVAARDDDLPVGVPHWETSATSWRIMEDAAIAPTRRTLRVFYTDIEGTSEHEARQFATAVFKREWSAMGFTQPETILADVTDDD